MKKRKKKKYVGEMNLKTKNSKFLLASCVTLISGQYYIWLWIFNYRWTSTCYEVGPIWRTSGCQFSWLKPGGFIWYQNHSCRYFSCVNFILFVIDWIFTLHSIQGFRIYRVSHLVLKQSKGLKVRKSRRQFMVA